MSRTWGKVVTNLRIDSYSSVDVRPQNSTTTRITPIQVVQNQVVSPVSFAFSPQTFPQQFFLNDHRYMVTIPHFPLHLLQPLRSIIKER